MTHCDIVPVLRPFLWWTDYITVLLTAPKRSITRPGLSSPIQSSRHSGNNVVCPRSTPSSRKSRKNLTARIRENQSRRSVFTKAGRVGSRRGPGFE